MTGWLNTWGVERSTHAIEYSVSALGAETARKSRRATRDIHELPCGRMQTSTLSTLLNRTRVTSVVIREYP